MCDESIPFGVWGEWAVRVKREAFQVGVCGGETQNAEFIVGRHAYANYVKRNNLKRAQSKLLQDGVSMATAYGRKVQLDFERREEDMVYFSKDTAANGDCYLQMFLERFHQDCRRRLGAQPTLAEICQLPATWLKSFNDLSRLHVQAVGLNVYHVVPATGFSNSMPTVFDTLTAVYRTFPAIMFGEGYERFASLEFDRRFTVAYPKWRARIGAELIPFCPLSNAVADFPTAVVPSPIMASDVIVVSTEVESLSGHDMVVEMLARESARQASDVELIKIWSESTDYPFVQAIKRGFSKMRALTNDFSQGLHYSSEVSIDTVKLLVSEGRVKIYSLGSKFNDTSPFTTTDFKAFVVDRVLVPGWHQLLQVLESTVNTVKENAVERFWSLSLFDFAVLLVVSVGMAAKLSTTWFFGMIPYAFTGLMTCAMIASQLLVGLFAAACAVAQALWLVLTMVLGLPWWSWLIVASIWQWRRVINRNKQPPQFVYRWR